MKKIPILRNVFDANHLRKRKIKDNVFGAFLVNNGLYKEIEITQENIYELADLVGGHVKIDVYCPNCRENRVFSCEMIPYYWYDENNDEIMCRALEEEIISWQNIQMLDRTPLPTTSVNLEVAPWVWTNNSLEDDTRIMVFKFSCAMENTHHLDYVVLNEGNKMKKIGQYPSVADLSCPELKEYSKVMSKEDERELKRAIGLFSSGIGIGSFVYLRRIFERIIITASKKAISDGKITEDVFNRARVEERIKMLADYLPKSLVSNSYFYGIVSKGIHMLSEEECLEYFPVMESFIIMILRQWEKIRKDEEEEKKLSAALNKIASKVE